MKADRHSKRLGLRPQGIKILIVNLPAQHGLGSNGQPDGAQVFDDSPGFFDGQVGIVHGNHSR